MSNYPPRILVCVLILLTFLLSTGAGQESLELASDDLTVLKVAETAVQLGRQFRDSIWPGYNLDQFPLIVYIPERWALLLNAPPFADNFVDYPGAWPDLRTNALYHPGQYGELVGQLAFNIQIDSMAVAAVAFTGQKARSFLEYVVHENFHQFQNARFGDIQWEREELYPIEDVTNTSLAGMEILLLKQALEFLSHSARDSALSRVRQFVAIRSYRWQNTIPYVARYEQGQEIKEGTAKYIEVKAISLVSELHYRFSLESAADTLMSDLASVTMTDCIIEGLNKVIADGTIAPEDMPRNRIYPLGAAQGFLLDQLAVNWKSVAQQAGHDFTFADLLGTDLGYDSSQMESVVAEAKKLCDYEKIYQKSKKAIAAYRTGFDSAVTSFESQPGVRVDISLNGKNLLRSRSSRAKKWLADNGSKEYRNHYDIYVLRNLSRQDLPFQLKELKEAQLLDLIGQEFLFQLKGSGLLEVTNWSTDEKMLVFYCPEVQSLTVDEIAKNLTDDAEYQFEKLQLDGVNFELKCGRTGIVSISRHRISIKLLS